MHEFSDGAKKRREKEKYIGRKDLHNVHYYSLLFIGFIASCFRNKNNTGLNEKLTQTPAWRLSWDRFSMEIFWLVRVDGVYCQDQIGWELSYSATSRVSTNFRSRLQISAVSAESFRFIKSVCETRKIFQFPLQFSTLLYYRRRWLRGRAGEIGKHRATKTLAFVSTDWGIPIVFADWRTWCGKRFLPCCSWKTFLITSEREWK